MWEAILVSLLSFSVSMRAPKVENVPFDYELSCQIENTTNRSDFLFKYDYYYKINLRQIKFSEKIL